nr:pathogenicity-like protein [uncultured Pseudoxanthomonas sp.]
MRQVFSSQRIETVEGVARMLTEAGIPVHISNGRSYHSKRGGQFSYTEPVKAQLQPAVWVRHADDQPRARELLREAGLLESTRPGYASTLTFSSAQDTTTPQRSWAWRIRLVLLALIALAAVVMWLRRPAPPPAVAPPVPAQTVPTAPAPADEEEDRIRIQPVSGD